MADETTMDELGGGDGAAADGGTSRLDEAREKFGRVAEEVKDRYQRVSGDVQRRAERASDDLRRGAGIARERYREASETLREGYGEAQQRARLLNRDLNDYVQENPGKAVLIAASVGFLVGLLFRGRD